MIHTVSRVERSVVTLQRFVVLFESVVLFVLSAISLAFDTYLTDDEIGRNLLYLFNYLQLIEQQVALRLVGGHFEVFEHNQGNECIHRYTGYK